MSLTYRLNGWCGSVAALALALALSPGCGDDALAVDAAASDAANEDGHHAPTDAVTHADAEVIDALVMPDATQDVLTDPAADAALENPDVELSREVTFEQPDGTEGWSDSASVIFNWQDAATGRDRVPDAMVRMATGINLPEVVHDVTYRGDAAVRLTMQDWGQSTFRSDIGFVGDLNASPPVDRRFMQGQIHVVGFAMRIEHSVVERGPDGSGFQLYHQYHNGSPPKEGYGTTNNPALSLLRDSDTDLSIALRDNRPGGERLSTFEVMPNTVRAGQWVRWVFKTRFANFDSGENGLVEVYSAVGDEPLTMHVRIDDRPLGYVYQDPDHSYETINFDMYGSPQQNDAAVYVDEVRVVDGDVAPEAVDPIHWVSYQNRLNEPYNDDLR